MQGIDGIYLGPLDLGLSLGHEPSLDPSAPEVLEAIAQIGQWAKAAGKVAGCHCGSPEMVRRVQGQGFDFGSLLTDVRILANALTTQVASYLQTTAQTSKGY